MLTEVFIDESIHDRGDFIAIAIVFTTHDIQAQVEEALTACGFKPGQDEFKSSMSMRENPAAQELRARIRHLLMEWCSLAFVLCPVAERDQIARYAAQLIVQICARDESLAVGVAHFDEGMDAREIRLPDGWTARVKCDSRTVAGIQIADCAASVIAVQILTELGLVEKVAPVGGYDEPVELAWALWTSVRYALAGSASADESDENSPLKKPFGLYVTDSTSERVKEAAEKRLGRVWLGCIH